MSTTLERLTDFIDFKNGKAVQLVPDGEVRVFGSNGVIGRSKEALGEGAVIVGRVGAYCGAVHLCEGPFWATDNTIVARPRSGHSLRYIYYLLKKTPLREYAGGAAQPLITQQILTGVKAKLHTPTQSKIIAEILSAYDDLIENNRRRIKLLEAAARMLYREWFVHFRFPGHEHVRIIDGLPQGWERRKLAHIVDVVKDTVKPPDFAEDDIHIGLEHIPRRSFTLAEWEPAEDLASGKTRFAEGDILFCKIRPYFHKVGFTLRSGLASSDAIVWRVKESEDWPLVVCATASDHFVAVASKTVREGSKMPRADEKVLLGYSVPKPPEGLLSVFNNSIMPITQQCKTLALQNRALAQARDIFLPRLMNGEIAV